MAKPKGPRKKGPAAGLDADMYDEVDTFHRDSGSLDNNNEEEEEPDAEPIMDLDDSEDDSDADLEGGGTLAKVIAAERALKRKHALRKAMDTSDAEESEEDAARDEQWGSKKSEYYDDDGVDADFDSDDELAAEEAEEALRLQRVQASKLSRSHFGLAGSDEEVQESGSGSGSEDEAVAAHDKRADAGSLATAVAGTSGVRSERVVRTAAALSSEEQEAAVLRDAPELLALLQDLAAAFQEVRGRSGPLLKELQGGGIATDAGLSYLEAKHLLLLMYCINSLFYVLLKLEGRSVREHPVVQRLLTVKAYLEKLRPIDKRLKGQIDKLLRASEVALTAGTGEIADAEEDPEMYRPDPSALVSQYEDDGTASAGPSAVYKPPKLAPLAMDDPAARQQAAQAQRKQRATLRHASNNQFVRDLAAEVGDAPEEVRQAGDALGDNLEFLKEKQKLEARARVEEDLMTRVALTKDERKALKAKQRAGLSGSALVSDFADDAMGVLDVGRDEASFFDKVRLGQKFGGGLAPDGSAVGASADAELPSKAGLSERRAKYDSVKARQQAQLEMLEQQAAAHKRPREHDDLYLEARAAADAKKSSKASKRQKPALKPPLPDPTSTEARAITTEIEKNRGLTPHRRKDIKNPRKHQRMKHAEKEKRRKGQVVSARKQEGPYSGEATGIKARVAKSTRL